MSDPRQPPKIGAGISNETTEPADMQFEQFEPAPSAESPGESGVESESTEPSADVESTGPAACAACKQPITDAYFEAGGQVFCPQCRQNYEAEQTGGSRVGRMLRAVVFGTLAGLGGTIIWFGVRKLTGYEVGLIAVVVGLMVGGAVRAGSRGRGGAFYQLLAVFITYSAIAANYVPDVFQAMFEDYEEDRTSLVAATAPASQPSTQPESAAAESGSDATATAPDDANGPAGAGRTAVALILISLIAFAIAFVAPVMAGFENIIGLLIIGFALWEAWKINKRTVVNFTGPYALAGGDAPPPPIPGAGTV